MADIKIGLKATTETLVTEDITAKALGSGVSLVLATPFMISLMERTSMKAINGCLSENEATVGTHVDVYHKKAAAVGKTVITESEVIEIDRRKITFLVKTTCEGEVIGEGKHDRFVIDKTKFGK